MTTAAAQVPGCDGGGGHQEQRARLSFPPTILRVSSNVRGRPPAGSEPITLKKRRSGAWLGWPFICIVGGVCGYTAAAQSEAVGVAGHLAAGRSGKEGGTCQTAAEEGAGPVRLGTVVAAIGMSAGGASPPGLQLPAPPAARTAVDMADVPPFILGRPRFGQVSDLGGRRSHFRDSGARR